MELDDTLTGLPPHRREVLEARVERWRPDLVEALTGLYDDPEAVADRLVGLAADGFAARDDELHALDLRRSLAPDWFQRPDALGYAAYAERFAGTLADVAARVGYLDDLGVTYLHLMPLLQPRPGNSDGGYAVMDYGTVRPDLGTTADLRGLTSTLRAHGISLCLDLVLNHVAREHEWARRARAGEQRYRDYFLVFPDRTVPDAYERTLPEVFPDFAPGSFTFDAELDGWVWTTFNDFQWDVDWSNPDVLAEYAAVVLDLANHGVEVLRLDAIAFIAKEMGTSSQNLPSVHALTQALRTVARIACPAVVLKAEAIVGPQDLPAYLGRGRHHGKVSDLAYHNVLMVHLWSMLATRDARMSSHALQQLPAPPSTTAWVVYARCHDDIGWAVSDEDAAAAGLDGFAHRRFLSEFYAGDFPGSWSDGLVFQENEATGDRRISGSLASLAGLGSGDPHGRDRVLLAHALVLGFGGLPVLWMGDEIGLTNDESWADDPAHADDNRWAHRPPMPWPAVDEHAVRPGLDALVAARRGLPRLHASVATEVLDPVDPAVFTTLRRHPLGPLLSLYNVGDAAVRVPAHALAAVGLDGSAHDHVGGGPLPREGDDVWLRPYGVAWLTAAER
ncbi:MAG: alpha-amylase family protein [Nocardioidaceae bacterium]|nr:alpha-amylase family protein [Nocardioidaceae bacterium]